MKTQVSPEIVEKIVELTGFNNDQVTPDKELYYDLRISGWDMDQLVDFMILQYGLPKLHFDMHRLSPGEGFSPLTALREFLGQRPFFSFKVEHLELAAKSGCWHFRHEQE